MYALLPNLPPMPSMLPDTRLMLKKSILLSEQVLLGL